MGNCEGSQHRTAVRRRKLFFSGRGEKEEGGGALSAVGGKRGRRHFTLVPAARTLKEGEEGPSS